MKDIKLVEKCNHCGANLMLMGSIAVSIDKDDPNDGKTFLVKKCLNCGEYPVTEVIEIVEEEEADNGSK